MKPFNILLKVNHRLFFLIHKSKKHQRPPHSPKSNKRLRPPANFPHAVGQCVTGWRVGESQSATLERVRLWWKRQTVAEESMTDALFTTKCRQSTTGQSINQRSKVILPAVCMVKV